MAITAITPSATTNKVYGWLKTDAAMKVVNGNGTFSTVMAAFAKADDRTAIKERKYLGVAVVSNASGNIIEGLEKIASLPLSKLTSADANISGAAAATKQLNITGNNGVAVKYTSSNTDVATVSDTGLVTYVATGAANIKVETADSVDYFAQSLSIPVTVS